MMSQLLPAGLNGKRLQSMFNYFRLHFRPHYNFGAMIAKHMLLQAVTLFLVLFLSMRRVSMIS